MPPWDDSVGEMIPFVIWIAEMILHLLFLRHGLGLGQGLFYLAKNTFFKKLFYRSRHYKSFHDEYILVV